MNNVCFCGEPWIGGGLRCANGHMRVILSEAVRDVATTVGEGDTERAFDAGTVLGEGIRQNTEAARGIAPEDVLRGTIPPHLRRGASKILAVLEDPDVKRMGETLRRMLTKR